MVRKSSLTDIRKQMRAANARGRAEQRSPCWPTDARYDRQADRFEVETKGGWSIAVPRAWYGELTTATPAELEKVAVSADTVFWESLDVHIAFPGMLRRALGDDFMAREGGRVGGRVKSKAKTAAARANGAKGGRPRKRRAA